MANPRPLVRRQYQDVGDRQMHLRIARPASDTGRAPVICFHMSPHSGRIYEQFLEEIIVARTIEEVVDALHRFSVFLETLLGQVNMRAVLADHAFDYPDVE